MNRKFLCFIIILIYLFIYFTYYSNNSYQDNTNLTIENDKISQENIKISNEITLLNKSLNEKVFSEKFLNENYYFKTNELLVEIIIPSIKK